MFCSAQNNVLHWQKNVKNLMFSANYFKYVCNLLVSYFKSFFELSKETFQLTSAHFRNIIILFACCMKTTFMSMTWPNKHNFSFLLKLWRFWISCTLSKIYILFLHCIAFLFFAWIMYVCPNGYLRIIFYIKHRHLNLKIVLQFMFVNLWMFCGNNILKIVFIFV